MVTRLNRSPGSRAVGTAVLWNGLVRGACSNRLVVDPNYRQWRLAQITAKLLTDLADRDFRAQLPTQNKV
jgi:hypothetical protein